MIKEPPRVRCRPARTRVLRAEALERRDLLAGTASISGLVWNDLDGDRARVVSEPSLGGITVFLDVNDNNALDAAEPTQITGADGSYSFQNLDAGSYVVREVVPANHRITSPQVSGQRLFVVDGLGPPHRIVELNPTTGAQIRSFAAPCTGITIFAGLAFDGKTLYSMCDANDTLYRLDPNNGAVLGSTVLAAGNYGSIAALGGKLYILRPNNGTVFIFDLSTNTVTGSYTFQAGLSPQNSLGDSAGTGELLITSAYSVGFLDPATGFRTHSFQMAGPLYGFDAKSVDAVGDEIFVTHSSVGRIEVYSRSGTLLRTLNAVTVGFLNEGAGYADLTGSHRLSLTAGQAATNINFGNQYGLTSIRGTRWQDSNGNGVQDSGEAPLPGKTMYLDVNDNASRDAGEPTAVTGANGSFVFSNLQPGLHIVRSELTPNYVQTFPANTKNRLFTISDTIPQATIYELNPKTGAILNSFPAPQSFAEPIAFDGKWLYYASLINDTLYKLNPDTGAVAGSLQLPLNKLPSGLAAVGGLLYLHLQGSFAIVDPVTMTFAGTFTPDFQHLGPFYEVGQLTDPQRLLGLGTAGEIIQVDPKTGSASIGFTLPNRFASITAFDSKFYAVDLLRTLRVYSSQGTLLQTVADVPGDKGVAGVGGPGGAQRITLAPGQNATGADFGTTEPVPVNQAPMLAAISNPPTILEDATTQTVNLAGISAGAGETQTLTITATSSNPSLIPDPTVSYSSPAATGALTFAPVANKSGSAVITVTVKDDGGTAGGGVDTVTRTFTVNVTPVNDPPSGEDRKITVLDHVPHTFSAADFGFSDAADAPSPNAFYFVIVTTVPAAGSLTRLGAPVAPGTGIWVTHLSGLVYTPGSSDFNSQAAYASFTFQVADDGGTGSGGLDIDPTPSTITIDLVGGDTAPSGISRTITKPEDGIHTFAAEDFGFSDTGDSPPHSFQAVHILSLPTAGQLKLSGASIVAGQVVPHASIAELTFDPVPNASGFPYAQFTFQVQDTGGSTGGPSLDPTPKTITINVTSVNDPPVTHDRIIAGKEDTAHTFSVSEFSFSDFSDTPSNSLASIIVTVPPAASGTLRLGAALQTPGSQITVPIAQVGQLAFTPVANANRDNAPEPTIAFRVQDNGGALDGGVDTSVSPKTITFFIASVNDAPLGDPAVTIDMLEDASYAFSIADFGFADPSDNPPNTFSGVQITSNPVKGTLFNGVTPVSSGAIVPRAVIDAGNFRFVPASNANGSAPPYASFTFSVRDDGGTAFGGVDFDATARTMSINVTPVNDPPRGTNTTVPVEEDTSYVLSPANFAFADQFDTPANSLLALKVTTLPPIGTLTVNGVPVSTEQFVPAADIAAGRFRFTPSPNYSGITSFTFQVQDNGGTANDGLDLDLNPQTLTFIVHSTCYLGPSSSNLTVTTPEDAPYLFGPVDFPIFDEGDNLVAVRLTSLPPFGSLQVNGAAAVPGQFVAAADLASGKLRFVPPENANGPALTSFLVQLDHAGTVGGVCVPPGLDPAPLTVTVNVLPVNDPPSGADKTINPALSNVLVEDGTYAFGAADFGFSDPLDAPANSLSAINLTSLPTSGTLTLNGIAVSVGDYIPAASVTSLVFTPPPNGNGATYTTFTFQVHDNGGTAAGGVDLDPVPKTMTLSVAPVNDVPSFLKGDDKDTTDESGPQAFAAWATGLSAGPPNEAAQQLHFEVRANTSPSLFLAGPAISSSGTLTFTPAPNASGAALITIVLVDSGGTASDGSDTTSPQTFTINVTKPRRWYNAANPLDVKPDGKVVPGDALEIINYINAFGSTPVLPTTPLGPPYYDATGDNSLAPNDALAVINHINAFGTGEGESIAAWQTSAATSRASDDHLLTLLALDVASQPKRRRT